MREQVRAHLESNHKRAVASLCEFLRIASISTQPDHAGDVAQSAQWVHDYLAGTGFDAQIWPTEGHPAVYAEWLGAGDAAPTVLIYGHHDVQPTGDLALWTSPPFEPVARGGRIVARGAADDKGQVFCQILAAEAWLRVAKRCPVNLKFLIEGEEETGSPNLVPLVRRKREQLACDIVVVSDTPLWKPGHPAISLGTRGLMGVEVKVLGPNRDLHSGMYGGSVPNPIAVLCSMLAKLHDEQNKVTVPYFYDDVEDPRDSLHPPEFDDAAEAGALGCGLRGEEGFSTLQRRWTRPTLEFNGITGGYQGPGSNTIVPSWASAKITCRLVPRQDPDRLALILQEYLRQLAPPALRVELLPRKVNSPAYSIDASHPALASAARAYHEVYGVEPVRVREGLTLPILPAFKSILGADTVLMGFCDPDCRAHSFDEFFDTADLLRGARTAALFLDEFAQARFR